MTLTMARTWSLRQATAADVRALASLWHEAWYDAHGAHVPRALCEKRMPDYFLKAMSEGWPDARLAQSGSEILGFHLTRAPVLDLLFVARKARRKGLGSQLLADAEMRLRASGCAQAELDCLAANQTARRFYERHGWIYAGPITQTVPSEGGDIDVHSVIYHLPLR